MIIKGVDMLYQKAEDLAGCLYGFPYQAPSEVPPSVKQDRMLMEIITETHKTTIGPDGKIQQTTIDAAERIRLQAEFKARIYVLLDQCLAQDPEHGPALLLYPRVAEYNTRAKDREPLIALNERLLPRIDEIRKGTRAYKLIEINIEGLGGNCFDMVERHLADFHYELAVLYKKTDQDGLARTEYRKACKLCPKIYGRGDRKVKLL
jgi:hypothetical protein